MTTHDTYITKTDQGRQWRIMGYWFCVGWQEANAGKQGDTDSDEPEQFGQFCAQIIDRYESGETTAHSSIPDMWTDYLFWKEDPDA